MVVPFNALEKDYIRRLRLANIQHIFMRYGETRYAPVVVVALTGPRRPNLSHIALTRSIVPQAFAASPFLALLELKRFPMKSSNSHLSLL